jgi:endonuclease/exonuclease/phosphatase family metal-dependent hydrolase
VLLPVLGLAAAGCAAPQRLAEAPEVPPCRVVERAQGGGPAPEVRWIAPAAPEDRRVLRDWCDTVGGVVVEAAPAAAVAEGTDTLVVVSWNVHVGAGDLDRLVRGLRAGTHTGGRAVTHFVLLLQEVHRTAPRVPGERPAIPVPRGQRHAPADAPRVDVVEAARRLGLSLYYVPSMRNGYTGDPATEEDRGNAVLSTLPLSGFAVAELPVQRQRRAAAVATVAGTTSAGEPWCLRVASAHLDVLLNSRQARALTEALAPERTLVLGGDFNSPFARFGTVRHVRDRFPASPEARYGRTHANGRLDYLFFRSADRASSRVTRIDDRHGSDHHPLVGWFPVPRDGGAACPGSAPADLSAEAPSR